MTPASKGGAGTGGGASGPVAGAGAPGGALGADRLAVTFARVLRGSGLRVPGDAVVHYAEALAAVGLEHRDRVYWAGRATLVRRPEDVAAYDAAFDAFWAGRPRPATEAVVSEPVTVVVDEDDGDEDAGQADEEEDGEVRPVVHLRYSPTEVLRDKDFAACTPEELAELWRLLSAVRGVGPTRPSRRRRPAGPRAPAVDLRRTVRRALRTGGEAVRFERRGPTERPRRLIFLCDVSGSMAPYSRALVRFLHVVVAGRPRVEAFTIGSRLTRISRSLAVRDPDAALAAAAAAVPDWSGGTRLGEALRQFNDRWGVRGMARGAVVVILSDGWDRGDPEQLATEMGRLARVAHRIVWVNPLKASPGYAPLVRGMAAALPYVDEFVEGHSLASLEALVALLGELDGDAGVTRRAERERIGPAAAA